jgi:hypothetical protein
MRENVRPNRCVRCGEEIDDGKKRCDICDEKWLRSNEVRKAWDHDQEHEIVMSSLIRKYHLSK